MTIDHDKLRALAGHACDNPGDTADAYAFQNAASPSTVIALLDEIERLERARASWEADALVYAQNAEHAKENQDKARAERDRARQQLAAAQAECERLRIGTVRSSIDVQQGKCPCGHERVYPPTLRADEAPDYVPPLTVAMRETARLSASVAALQEENERLRRVISDNIVSFDEFQKHTSEERERLMDTITRRNVAMSGVIAAKNAALARVAELERDLATWQRCFKFPDGETDFAIKRARFWLGKGETKTGDGKTMPYPIEPDFDAVAEDRASEFAQAVVALAAERDVMRAVVLAARALRHAWHQVPAAHSYQRDSFAELSNALDAIDSATRGDSDE